MPLDGITFYRNPRHGAGVLGRHVWTATCDTSFLLTQSHWSLPAFTLLPDRAVSARVSGPGNINTRQVRNPELITEASMTLPNRATRPLRDSNFARGPVLIMSVQPQSGGSICEHSGGPNYVSVTDHHQSPPPSRVPRTLLPVRPHPRPLSRDTSCSSAPI